MHRDHAVATALGQRLAVGLGKLDGRGACGRHVSARVHVVRHLIAAVAQVGSVDYDVERHLPNAPALQFIRMQPG